MFILTSLTLPAESATAFSSTGASCLHGPHHGAQKSTSTGWRAEAAITSCPKDAVVTSFTAEAGAPPPEPVPIAISPSPSVESASRGRTWGGARGSAISRGAQRNNDGFVAHGAQECDEIGARQRR